MPAAQEELNISLGNLIKFMILVSSRAKSSSLYLTVYDPCNIAQQAELSGA